MSIKLSPSMLSIDFGKVAEQLKIVEDAGTQYIHLDVMDGIFVPNISFGIPVIKSIRKDSKMVFDTHLMIVEPEKYVEEFVKAGSDLITFHVEATKYPVEVIQQIKAAGAKAGIVLNPRTPVEVVYPFIKDVDMVLVMTVEPGFGGQSYIEAMNEKISKAREMIDKTGKEIELEIDGGVTPGNISVPAACGISVAVAGSSVFKAEDAGKAIAEMRANAK
jgi:ribulose-phosphate 3-epimerase